MNGVCSTAELQSDSFSDKGRVVFFCPEVELVRQQYELIEKTFPGADKDFLVGTMAEDSFSIEEMVRANQVTLDQRFTCWSSSFKCSWTWQKTKTEL